MIGQLVNTDIQPLITLYIVLRYLIKYISKSETLSVLYIELQSQVLLYTNTRIPLLYFVSKLFNKLVSKYDQSIQEVSYLLLDLLYQDTTYQVIIVNYQPKKVQHNLITITDETVQAQQSLLCCYQDYITDQVNLALANMTLFEQLQSQNQFLWVKQPRAPLQVINYFLYYINNLVLEQYKDYYHIQLILYYLFKRLIDLLSINSYNYRLYYDAFYACQQLYTYPDNYYTNPITNNPNTDSEYKSDCTDKGNKLLADFEAFTCQQLLNHDLTCTFTDNLRTRELDYTYNQILHISRDTVLPDTWDLFKHQYTTKQAVSVDSDPGLLNTEQQKLYNIMITQYT